MSSLYVNESGAVISVEGGYFCVTQKNGLVRKIPKELLESITLFGNSSITTPCIQECLRRGVQVNYFSGKGAYYGRLSSTRHVNGERLRQQVHACEKPSFRLPLARKITTAKIRNPVCCFTAISAQPEYKCGYGYQNDETDGTSRGAGADS